LRGSRETFLYSSNCRGVDLLQEVRQVHNLGNI
jgi:hypothetical protein